MILNCGACMEGFYFTSLFGITPMLSKDAGCYLSLLFLQRSCYFEVAKVSEIIGQILCSQRRGNPTINTVREVGIGLLASLATVCGKPFLLVRTKMLNL